MRRQDEFKALLEEVRLEPPELAGTLDRAAAKQKHRRKRVFFRSLGSMAAGFALFVLLVNFCAPVAYACSKVPGLRELARAVTFSRSLSEAVENEYVQPMELSQTENGVTAEIVYLIVDQKQVNVFYRLRSEEYPILIADPGVCDSQGGALHCSLLNRSFELENGELGSFTIDFTGENVPESLTALLKVHASNPEQGFAEVYTEQFPDFTDIPEPDYLAEFAFPLEFDPLFTAAGRIYPVNQTVELDGQKITIDTVEVYPSQLRVNISDDPENTAWLRALDFYVTTGDGQRFDIGSGITATGTAGSKTMHSFRCESPYFYTAEDLKLVIIGARWLRKDMETAYVNLLTGETGPLPEGVSLHSAQREGEDWIVSLRIPWQENTPMVMCFGMTYHDPQGDQFDCHQVDSHQGQPDGDGQIRYYLEQFPLKDYPHNEVWLEFHYSHYRQENTEILIPVE